jgi:hypothetical protein
LICEHWAYPDLNTWRVWIGVHWLHDVLIVLGGELDAVKEAKYVRHLYLVCVGGRFNDLQ